VRPREIRLTARARPADALAIAILLAAVAGVVAFHRDYGVSWDEQFYVESGRSYLAHFFEMGRLAEEVGTGHLRTHGGLVDGLYFAALEATGDTSSFERLHLLKALAGVLVLLAVYGILRRIEPAGRIPVAGMLLLACLPAWSGQVFDNHMDGSAALLYALQMLVALQLLGWPRADDADDPRALLAVAAFGALSAVAFSHRASLAVIPGAWLLLTALRALSTRGWTRWMSLALCFAFGFCAVLWVVDPWVRLRGPAGLFEKLYYSARPGKVATLLVRYDGEVLRAGELPRSYLPRWIAMTVPTMTLALLALGVGRLAAWLRPGAAPARRLQAAFLLLSLLAPVAAAVGSRAALFAAWRHFLFLSVPIAVIAALGLGLVVERVAPRWRPAVAAAFAAGLVWIGAAMVRLHPYEFLYVNALQGGLPGIAGRFEADYWGRSYREAAHWIAARAGDAAASVHACGPSWQVDYYLPERFTLTPDVARADFVVCFLRPGFATPDEPPSHVIERDGVALARIWDRRRSGPPASPP